MLPQSADRRVLAAASEIVKKGLARITLLGRPAEVAANADKHGIDISGCEVLDFLVSGGAVVSLTFRLILLFCEKKLSMQ